MTRVKRELDQINDDSIRKGMIEITDLMERARSLEETAKVLKESAAAKARELLAKAEADTVVIPGRGTWSHYKSTRKTLDANAAKERLLEKGVPAPIIQEAFDAATKVTETEVVRFNRSNGNDK